MGHAEQSRIIPPPYPPIGEGLRRRRTGQTHEHINLWVFVVKYEDQELI